jgi:hypothetical protein
MQIDPSARPPVDSETLKFLRELKNSGVFDTQYDAWAFGAAYALVKGLTAAEVGSGREPLPPLNTLNEDTRFALEQAAVAELEKHPQRKVKDLTEYINRLAVAGLTQLRREMANWSVAERIKWITEQCSKPGHKLSN